MRWGHCECAGETQNENRTKTQKHKTRRRVREERGEYISPHRRECEGDLDGAGTSAARPRAAPTRRSHHPFMMVTVNDREIHRRRNAYNCATTAAAAKAATAAKEPDTDDAPFNPDEPVILPVVPEPVVVVLPVVPDPVPVMEVKHAADVAKVWGQWYAVTDAVPSNATPAWYNRHCNVLPEVSPKLPVVAKVEHVDKHTVRLA